MYPKKLVSEKLQVQTKNPFGRGKESITLEALKQFIQKYELSGIPDSEVSVSLLHGSSISFQAQRDMTPGEILLWKEEQSFSMVQSLRSSKNHLEKIIAEKKISIEAKEAKIKTITQPNDKKLIQDGIDAKKIRLAEYEETLEILNKDLLTIDKRSYEEIKDIQTFVDNFLK